MMMVRDKFGDNADIVFSTGGNVRAAECQTRIIIPENYYEPCLFFYLKDYSLQTLFD
jgi:hypothetical protein